MNVRLVKDWKWQSGVIFNDDFFINSYSARVYMYTTRMDATEHATAYERMEHWFGDVMQDSVMIAAQNPKISAYESTGQRLLIFPDDPVDQLVGIMLCLKLNSMTESRLIITDVDISSSNGNDMTYQHNQSEEVGPFAAAGWWTDPRPSWTTASSRTPSTKVVSLSRVPEWHALGLDWSKSDDNSSAVVFADFDRNDDQ